MGKEYIKKTMMLQVSIRVEGVLNLESRYCFLAVTII